MRESTVEKYLCTRVKALGGLSYKWVSPGRRGVNDQIVILPGRTGRPHILFVELKSERGVESKHQNIVHAQLKVLRCEVFTCRSNTDIDAILELTLANVW